MQSLIKDINLAAEGRKKIDWVSNFMPTLNILGDRFEKNKLSKAKQLLFPFTWKLKLHTLQLC